MTTTKPEPTRMERLQAAALNYVDVWGSLPHSALLEILVGDGWILYEVSLAITQLVNKRRLHLAADDRLTVVVRRTYFRPWRWGVWPAIAPAFGCLIAVLMFTAVLFVLLLCFAPKAKAAEGITFAAYYPEAPASTHIPHWVLRGIAMVETSSTWRDIGNLDYRNRALGPVGEVGPWQLSPAALEDLGALKKAARVHRDPVFAESLTRAWLLRLRRQHTTWFEAVGFYHTGAAGDRRVAEDYARRVSAAAGESTHDLN